MKVNNIELEVGQEWRTKEDSKFVGTGIIISKIENGIVKCTINNMLFDETEHIVEESDLLYLHSY